MSAPINKKLPELTLDELTTVLKKATYRGYNVNKLAEVVEKNGVDQLAYNVLTNQVGIKNAEGKLKNKIKLSKIHSEEGDVKLSWSLTRFFKMHVFSCCFNHEAYDKRIETLAKELHNKIKEAELQATSYKEWKTVCNELNRKEQDKFNVIQIESNMLNKKEFFLMRKILKQYTDVPVVQLFDKGGEVAREFLDVNYNEISESIEIRSVTDQSKSLKFQFGTAITCLVDNRETSLKEIPADRSDWLMGSFKVAIELASDYALKNKKIEISVLKSGVEKNPSSHLDNLAVELKKAVEVEAHPILEVKLLKDDLTKAKGLDNGGISRDYLNSLFTSLIENSNILFKAQYKSKKPSTLFLPVATQPSVLSDNPETMFPGLTDIEKRILNEIGRVMMFCYNSLPNTEDFKNYSYGIGQHFDDLLFEVALTLNEDESKTNFEDLSLKSKIDMAKMIFEKFLGANQDAAIKDKLELFELFNWKEDLYGRHFNAYNLEGAVEYVTRETFRHSGMPTEDLVNRLYNEDDYTLNMVEINNNPNAFVGIVLNGLLNEKLGTTKVSELIAPIHAIAQGFRSAQSLDSEWSHLRNVGPRELNDKIQGSLDRKVIAAAFEVKTKVLKDGYMVDKPYQEIKELNKKTQWLKDWIESRETEDADIRKFLVYATGSNSLPKDQKIFIDEQSPQLDLSKNIIRNEDGTVFYNPTPTANTCSHTILMSPVGCGNDGINDRSEEAFKKMLYETILNVQSFEINQD